MKRIVLPVLILALAIGACVIPSLPAQSTSVPTSTSQETINTETATAQIEATLPSVTPASATNTSPPPINTDTSTATPEASLTPTLATATDFLFTESTVTTGPPPSPGPATLTPTLGILTYGTLPPDTPSSDIVLWNKSKREAYISLQVTLNDGRFSIIEYPVAGLIQVDGPIGSYVYVAWVGGKKMTGSFVLHRDQTIKITLYKDRIVIK